MAAVLFDFSGTLFHIEPVGTWLRATLTQAGIALPEDETAATARALDEAGALPGGSTPRRIPPELAEAWATRDRTAELHRAVYTGLSHQVPLPDPALHDALYDRHRTPDAWEPYPDALEVLRTLGERGIDIGVVSNIGWDLRPVFCAHGLDRHVDAYALSFEHGILKPDTELFRRACAMLGADPRETLMVGDDRNADGGAAALGCAVHFVEPLPVALRPHGLRPVLDLVPADGPGRPGRAADRSE